MLSIPFAELERAFAAGAVPVDTAEAHGSLCGALCVRAGFDCGDWVDEVLAGTEDAAAPHARELMAAVFDETARALGGVEMEFEPLLPDEDADLTVRVAALAQWCMGFLYGLGAGQLPSLDEIPGDVGEVLRAFSEIGRATVDAADGEESNEASYAELLEFVRAGTQLVYEELAAHREHGLPPSQDIH
jgi:uncharacterized protein YgfB (UPF0149 family)